MYGLMLAAIGLWLIFVFPTVFFLAAVLIGGFYILTNLPTPTEEIEGRGEKDLFDRDFVTYEERIKYEMDRLNWKNAPEKGTEDHRKAQELRSHIQFKRDLSDKQMMLEQLIEEREVMMKGAGTK